MNDSLPKHDGTRPPTEVGSESPDLAGAIVRREVACDRFEAELQAGRRPIIEEILEPFSETERQRLFHALLELELDYRRRAGERPHPQEYRDRFPKYGKWIESIWTEAESAG